MSIFSVLRFIFISILSTYRSFLCSHFLTDIITISASLHSFSSAVKRDPIKGFSYRVWRRHSKNMIPIRSWSPLFISRAVALASAAVCLDFRVYPTARLKSRGLRVSFARRAATWDEGIGRLQTSLPNTSYRQQSRGTEFFLRQTRGALIGQRSAEIRVQSASTRVPAER